MLEAGLSYQEILRKSNRVDLAWLQGICQLALEDLHEFTLCQRLHPEDRRICRLTIKIHILAAEMFHSRGNGKLAREHYKNGLILAEELLDAEE